VAAVADPLGGSYLIEALTDETEREAEEMFAQIDALGDGSILEGVLRGVESGWFTQRIAEAAFEEQRRFETGDLVQVGVNAFVEADEPPLSILQIPMETERAQIAAIERVRSERDGAVAQAALDALVEAAKDPEIELIEPLVACARARCTGGEVTQALQSVFGVWREAPAF
jgi:methylmalonyl-CoA mutase N-terminal domain/subunit